MKIYPVKVYDKNYKLKKIISEKELCERQNGVLDKVDFSTSFLRLTSKSTLKKCTANSNYLPLNKDTVE